MKQNDDSDILPIDRRPFIILTTANLADDNTIVLCKWKGHHNLPKQYPKDAFSLLMF